jgi:hypothetical protein
MNILLRDLNGKIPNVALMKLSTYYKQLGDTVGFETPNPDRIYISCIFKNLTDIRYFRDKYPSAEIIIGGSGYDLTKCLSNEIEYLKPDYSIYDWKVCNRCGNLLRKCECTNPITGKMSYSMGFTTRGCNRSCYFCIVPSKEGSHKIWQHPREFHNPEFSKMMILDNNWFEDENWFFETSKWIAENNIFLREGGMDIRLLTLKIAERLKQIRWWKPLKFAFDNDRDEPAVLDGIRILNDAKISTRNNVFFYVYVNDDTDKSFESALHRCKVLKENRAGAFVMFNVDNKLSERIVHLRRWANKKQLYWKIDFENYI